MKKLVTLSAVALAGATIGVGSTFGWWAAEDLESQPAQVAQNAPTDSKIESVTPVEAAFDSEGTQIDIIGDSQVQKRNTLTINLDPDNEKKIEQLANEIEQEAKQFDEKGQKELAEERRQLARRIRETLPKATIRFGKGPGPQWISRDGEKGKPGQEPPVTEIDRELQRLHEALGKTEDPAVREKIQERIHSLAMKLQQSRANGPQIKVQRFEFHDPRFVPPGHPDIPQHQRFMAVGEGPAGAPPLMIEELRKVAENLQREGHKEKAQAVREQIERMQRQMQEMQARLKQRAQNEPRDGERRLGDGPQRGDDRDRPHHEFRKEMPGHPEFRGPDPRDGERREREAGGFHGPDGHHPPMPMGHHHGEVLGLLQALHHEVGQLRGEVHQLRKMLGEGHHPQPGDLKRRKEGAIDAQKKQELLELMKKAKIKAELRDPEAKGKFKERDDDEKGKAKHRDEDAKGKAKQSDGEGKGKAKQDDDDGKGKAKERDEDDDDRKDKKKNRDDDDDDKDEDKNRKADDDDEQLDDTPAKPDDDAKGVEDKAAEAKADQED
ncbi:MAG: hypothetical protein JWN70_5957 [Planctomycetaceae bacterium]|nr:hypothetical protein [Planctomycetaceae bacterium]